jgi:steroid delta-isomerase-like uncharacterized protein
LSAFTDLGLTATGRAQCQTKVRFKEDVQMDNLESSKDVVRRFNTAINEGDADTMREVLDENFVHYDFQSTTHGPEEFIEQFMDFRRSFPDLKVELVEIIGEGEKVVNRVRFTGTHQDDFNNFPASGKPIDITGLAMFHLRDGRIYEHWTEMNGVGLAQQIGMIPKMD